MVTPVSRKPSERLDAWGTSGQQSLDTFDQDDGDDDEPTDEQDGEETEA